MLERPAARGGNGEGGGRGGDRPDDPGGGAVRDGSRHDGHEHRDRDRRQGRWNHGDRDPDRDHSLHAGDGVADDHGREGRSDDRAQAGVCDRVHHLRLRLADHRAVAESDRADDRLVGPGRAGGGADHAGDRGAGRVELRQARPSARVWARRRCGRDRGGAGAAGRRPVHHLRVVAVGVRRRGGHRAGDPRPDSPHERHAGGGGRPARPGRHGPVRARARCDRARHSQVRDVGARAAEAGRSRVARAVPGDLDDLRRRRWCWSCSCGGRTGGSSAARAR